jgi:hypothetical protein
MKLKIYEQHTNMSTPSWKAILELGRDEKKSKLQDDDRVESIMDYLLDKATKSCFDSSKNQEAKCNCLSLLDDKSSRNSVALWTLWFAKLEKETQQMLLMEKIRGTKLVLSDKRGRGIQTCQCISCPLRLRSQQLQLPWEMRGFVDPL